MAGTRGRARALGWVRWASGIVLAAITAAAVPPAAVASPHAPPRAATAAVSPSDQAATHAYLEALYRFQVAENAALPRGRAAAESTITALGSECAGVLAGAQGTTVVGIPSRSELESPRLLGERRRDEQELETIRSEIDESVLGALRAPGRSAEAEFDQTVSALHWSDPRIAEGLRMLQELLVFSREGQPPATVCADLRAWAKSRFETLGVVGKQHRQDQEALVSKLFSGTAPAVLLERFEGPAERQLIKRTQELSAKAGDPTRQLTARIDALLGKLGLREPAFHKAKPERTVGHGRTHTGTTVTVTRETAFLEAKGPKRCLLRLSVEYTRTIKNSHGILTGGSGTSICARGGGQQLSRGLFECSNGQQTITAVTPGATVVEVRLRDGRTIASRTIHVSARNGGPVDLYAQTLSAGSSRPVSLTERDQSGNVLRVVKVEHVHGCREESGLPEEALLARVPVASGAAVLLVAERLSTSSSGASGAVEVELRGGVEGRSEETFEPQLQSSDFDPQVGYECAPAPWAVVYGRLKAPATGVLAVTATGTVPLQLISFPASLHEAGTAAFAALASPPLELIVQGAGGQTLSTENLRKQAGEDAQFCEGYVEPASG